jgi:5-methylcytosine-specific restriction endonuclease McrA
MPKRKPKPKKAAKPPTLAMLKKQARTKARKALVAWSKQVRERDGNACVVCGKAAYLNAHHLIPRERFHQYELEIDNGIALCPSHHKYGSFSAHRHPIWFALWLRQNRPELFIAAEARITL